MGKRSKGKKRRPRRQPAGDRPGRRPSRYSTLELVLAALGGLLILLFLGILISSLV